MSIKGYRIELDSDLFFKTKEELLKKYDKFSRETRQFIENRILTYRKFGEYNGAEKTAHLLAQEYTKHRNNPQWHPTLLTYIVIQLELLNHFVIMQKVVNTIEEKGDSIESIAAVVEDLIEDERIKQEELNDIGSQLILLKDELREALDDNPYKKYYKLTR